MNRNAFSAPLCSDLEEDPLFSDLSPETRLSSPDWLSCSPPPSTEHTKSDGKTEVHKIVNRSVSANETVVRVGLGMRACWNKY